MKIDDFLNSDNEKYQIQVIAPTFTYGMMYSLDSKFDFDVNFDEYDTQSEWEYNILINKKVVATFHSLEEVKSYILSLENSTK